MSTSVPPRFCTDYAKRVAKCQKCKMQLEKGVLRMGKIMPNFFVAAKDPSKPPPDMKQYFHKNCLFEMLFKARPTTKVIDDTEEIEGFEDLNAEDQDDIKKLVDELTEKRSKEGPVEPKKTPAKKKTEDKKEVEETPSRKRKTEEASKNKRPSEFNEESDFNSFYKFIKVCAILKDTSNNTEKSAVISSLLQKKGFDGDLKLWLNFLIRESDDRNYNVTDEQLLKHFARILDTDEAKIQKYFTKSKDVALSISHAHEKKVTNEKGKWSLQKVDRYLEKLASLEEEDAVLNHLKFAAKRMRHDELDVLIRLIRKELDTEASTSTILKGVHVKAPKVFESDGLDEVVEKYYNNGFEEQQQKNSSSKKKVQEPKAKRSKSQKDSDDDDDNDEESEEEMSDSESEGEQDSDSDSEGEDEEEISGSDSEDVSEISSDEDEDTSLKENSPKKVARGTRTRPLGNDGSIAKKEECPPDMEACRYGEKCYRKNKDHLEQFWHPSH